MSKIDLIIDALLVAESSVWSEKIAEALVAARELKAKARWVGLTDDERNEMIGRIKHNQFTRQRDLIGSTQIITEMYLKEKNT